MDSTYTLCIRKGDVVTCKSDVPTLYKYKDIGFEDSEDLTEQNAGSPNNTECIEYPVENRRWYSAGKGLKVFQEVRARIAAGERFELPRETIIQIGKESDTAIKDLTEPSKNRLQFHLACSEWAKKKKGN